MTTFLRILRAFFALAAIWQLVGLAPAFGWLSYLDQVPAHAWAVVAVKVAFAAISIAAWEILRRVINRRRDSEQTSAAPLGLLSL